MSHSQRNCSRRRPAVSLQTLDAAPWRKRRHRHLCDVYWKWEIPWCTVKIFTCRNYLYIYKTFFLILFYMYTLTADCWLYAIFILFIIVILYFYKTFSIHFHFLVMHHHHFHHFFFFFLYLLIVFFFYFVKLYHPHLNNPLNPIFHSVCKKKKEKKRVERVFHETSWYIYM